MPMPNAISPATMSENSPAAIGSEKWPTMVAARAKR